METCFSKVTKRPAGIYQADLTPQPACRLPDFPFPFISGCSSINRDGQGEPFFFILVAVLLFIYFYFLPDPTLRDSSQAEGAWPVPRPFHPPKALGSRLPQMGMYLGGGSGSVNLFFFSSLSLLPPPPHPHPLLCLPQMTDLG